jgi:hypothetical protein
LTHATSRGRSDLFFGNQNSDQSENGNKFEVVLETLCYIVSTSIGPCEGARPHTATSTTSTWNAEHVKTKSNPRFFQASHGSYGWVATICQQLDNAVAPAATGSLVLGLVAALLQITRPADYLMATGLLLHSIGWFVNWLESVRR